MATGAFPAQLAQSPSGRCPVSGTYAVVWDGGPARQACPGDRLTPAPRTQPAQVATQHTSTDTQGDKRDGSLSNPLRRGETDGDVAPADFQITDLSTNET